MKNVYRCLPARLEVIKSVQPGQISLISRLGTTTDDSWLALGFPPPTRNQAAQKGRQLNRRGYSHRLFRMLSLLVARLNRKPRTARTWKADELTAAGFPECLPSYRLSFLPGAVWLTIRHPE